MEPVAREQFVLEQSKNHTQFKISESGLVVDADKPYLGASPDGIVFCSCHGKAASEIKCPYNYKDSFDSWETDRDFPLEKKNRLQ